MANNRLIVQQGQTAGAIGGTYDVFGTNLGAETLTVFDGTTVNFQGDFSRGGDTIRLTDVATDFTVVIAGSNAILTSVSDGITIVVPIPNVGTLGTTIIFENGAGDIVDSRVLVFNGTNVVLGTQTLTTSSQAVAPNGNGNSQNSIILTAGADTAPGGAADDTFIGFNKTLNAGDKLDGGTGFNTLSLSTDVSLTGVGDPAFTYGGFTTVNVQRIEVTNDDNLPVTLDLSGAKGVETVVALNSSMDTTFAQITGLNTGTNNDGNDIELNNVTNGAPADPTPDVTVQYQDSVVAGATTVDVLIKTSNADNLTIGSVSDANGGIETVNITNTAGASTLDTLDTDLTTLNILATQNLTIDDALNNTVRTINATGSTATLDIDFSDNDGAGEGVTYTGSAGVNLVQGGSAADNITTFDANDVIVTDDSIGFVDGNDTVNAGNGNNTVTSGIGADSITSGTGNDVINANNGNNIVNAGDGLNNVTTGTGNDTITTGKDADTISSGNGNDLISSGDGADLITIGSGEHTINSGAGADTVVAGANFDASTAAGPNILDQMDFGADIDELQLNAGATDAKFTNVSNLEILTLTSAGTTTLNNGVGGNGDSAAQAAGITTINLNAGNDSVNAADFTSALTINAANGGDDTVQTGSGSDVFNLGGALTDADSFNAGAGSDTLNLDGDVTVTGGGFTGFETVNLDDDEGIGANSYSLTLTNSNAPNPSTLLTINGSALQSDEGAFISTAAVGSFNSNITTGAGNDTVISGAIGDVITTNGGADTVNIKAGGFDNANLGDGNDLLLAGGALTTNDTAVGGAGTDTVDVVDAGRTIVDADFTNVSEFEVLNVAEAQTNTLGAQAQEAGLLKIVSTNGTSGTVINASGYTAGVTVDISATGGGLNNDNVTTGSGNDTVIAGVGDQSVSLGAGDDQVVVDGSEFTFADTVSGGSNTAVGDSIVLDNTLGGVTAGVNLNNVTGVENFQFKTDGNVGGGLFEPNASTITFTGGNVLTQTALNITAAALADTSDSLTVVIDGGQTDADFRFNVTGSVASTTVIKQNVDTNNDINFQGGTGVDRLEIHGNDLGSTVTMEGGAGRDVIAQTGGKFTDDGFVNINGVEILTATGGAKIDATLGIRASGADLDTIQDTNNNDLVTLDAQFTNALTVNLSGGNDTINGAASAAVLTFNAIDSNLTAADALTGGTTASDVLNVDANNGVADLTSVTKVETINIVDNDNPEPTAASTTLIIDTQVSDLSSGTVQTINAGDLDASEVLNLQGAGAGANLAVTGGAGADMITTGKGADTVVAGEGNNTVTTNAGNDLVTSLSGNDTITTGTGNDSIDAGNGNNQVFAGLDNDVVMTGGGSDIVDGGDGNDTISSGGGDDQIYGGLGLDVIDSGAGADQLLYRARAESSTSTGRDTVTGFTSGSDVIDVRYVAEAIANYGEGASINFAGNLGSFGDAQGATIAGDGIMDVVYDTSTGNLWVDLNDDGTLNGNDLQIVLEGVATLQAKDVLDTAATGVKIGQTSVEFGGPAAVGTFLADNFVLVDEVAGPGPGAWTVDGGLGNDQVQIDGDDISTSSITNVETAVINGSGTMTYAQHNAFGAVVSGTGEPQSVNLTGPVEAVTGAATIETYNLLGTVDGIGNPAGDNFTLGASGQNVNAGSGNDTINSGAIEIVTGKIDGGLGTDVLNLDTGDDISGAALFGIESTVINLSSVTMNAEQHGSNGLNGSAGQIVDPGDTFPNTTDTITITTSTLAAVAIDAKNSVGFAGTGITGVPQVENYVLSNLDDKFTLGSLGQNVNTGGGTNEITTGASDGQYTGTIGGSGADTLTLDAGDNIGGVNTGFGVFGNGNGDLITGAANVSAVETLKLTTGTVLMTVAQHEGFTTVIDTGGADTVQLTTGGTVNAEVVVDTYVADGNTDTHLIVNSGNADVNFTSIDGVPGDYDDSVTVGSFAVNGTWAVGGTTDTLNATAGGADISGVNTGNATTLEILNLAGAITATEAQHDAFTTINAAGGADSFTLTSSNGNDSVTGNAAVESYTLNDAFTFTLGSNKQNVTGNAANSQTVIVNGLTLTGNTLDGGTGAGDPDTLTLNTGTNITGATSITGFENVTVNGAVSMTYAQYNALLPTGGAGTDTITLIGPVATILGRTGIENYVLANLAGNDFTFHPDTDSVVTTGSNNDIVRNGSVTSFAGVTMDLSANAGGIGDLLSLTGTVNISGINAGAETTAETLEILTDAVTTSMTVAQHEGFTGSIIAAGVADTIALTTDGKVFAEEAIETYDLGSNKNTVVVNELKGEVNIVDTSATGDNDTVFIGTGVVANGTWNLSNSSDTLEVSGTSTKISGVNAGAATTAENLVLSGVLNNLTLTQAQHQAFTGTVTATAGADTLIILGAGAVTAFDNVENYNLSNASNQLTINAAETGVNILAIGGSNDTIIVGGNKVTGSWGLGAGDDTVTAANGADISGVNGGGATTVENIQIANNANVTMTVVQHEAFDSDLLGGFSAIGSNVITLTTDGTINARNEVEGYILNGDGVGGSTVNINDNFIGPDSNFAVSVTGAGGADTININGNFFSGTLVASGAWALAGADDTLVFNNGGQTVDISGVNAGAATTAETLDIAGNGGDAIMTVAQHKGFTTLTTSGGGTNSVTLTNDGTVTAFNAIEVYNLNSDGVGGSTINLGTNAGVDVNGTGGADTVNIGGLVMGATADFTLSGLDDTLIATNGADLTQINNGNATQAETLNITDDIRLTGTQYNAFTSVVGAGTSDGVTISTGGTYTAVNAIEQYVLQGNSTITFSGTDAIQAGQSVDLGTTQSIVAITNTYTSALDGTDSSVAILNFTTNDAIDVNGGALVTTNLVAAAGANANQTADIIVINGLAQTDLTDTTNGGDVEQAIAQAIGSLTAGTHLIVLESPNGTGQSGLYLINTAGVGDLQTSNFDVEFVGLVGHSAGFDWTAGNFA
ncbi:calcium-binding protein [Novosphingobium aquae]|uniref:Calcium-binding protein n=1 Tax=Novosphingobium aquae TaxID=3133435 RepID=A0ABU8S987_9SPHN